MILDENLFSRSLDVCIVTPIYFPKNKDFLSDNLHWSSFYVIGVDNDKEREFIEREANNKTILIYKAVDHIVDSLYSLYEGALYCKRQKRRFMFVFEMDLKFERYKPFGNQTILDIETSLQDIMKEIDIPFWMLGSPYMGPLNIARPEHLNGNAIYDLSSHCFAAAMHYLLTTHSNGNGYDVWLTTFVEKAHAVCKKTYMTTRRICNYWRVRTNMTNDERCWFVHY